VTTTATTATDHQAMVRNKGAVVPVTMGAKVGGPATPQSSPASRSASNRFFAMAGFPTTASGEPEKPKEKRPPKPEVELGLIDPPSNRALARALEVLLGESYLAGEVRRMPDGSIAQPRVHVTPKASQHPPGTLIAGQLVAMLLVLWTLVGVYFELAGDERLLAQLGDPARYVPNAVYMSRLVNETVREANFSGLYVTGWQPSNRSAGSSGTLHAPLVYHNFTCMRPVLCGTAEAEAGGFEEGECAGLLPGARGVFFESTEFLAERGVVFANRSLANVSEHVFPWCVLR
jgi:hypothetical protein